MLFLRDFHQNLIPLFSDFEQIDQLLFPTKSSGNPDFKGSKK